MKRFWTTAEVVERDGDWGIALDGRPLKTPAKADLTVPSAALADAIAGEWAQVAETIDPRAMPLTGLANAAIDRIAPDPRRFAAGLASYGQNDLTCYRAEEPRALVERQAESWDALQGWARRRYDVDFACVSGVMHVPQPDATVRRLAHEAAVLDPVRLAALAQLVTIGGSLVAGLAVIEQALPPDAAWEAVSLDERWQIEQWGADAEAEKALDARRRDFLAAARFAELL